MSTSEGKAMTIDDTKRDVASHILPDGTFINLPAATERDRAMFFARSIANFKLISANPLDRSRGTSSSAPPEDIEKFGVNNSAKIDSKSTKKLSSEYVHPLAVASARLQGVGAAELSKAINLSTLVGDYFGLANVITDDAATLAAAIVSSSAIENADLKSGGSAASLDKTKTPASAMLGSDQQQTVEEATRRLKEDQRLRALYLLRRKKLAYSGRISCSSDNSKNASSQTNVNGASQILSKHEECLMKSLKRQRVIDCRLLDLRKRWKLSLPDHGTKVIAPAQPHELVAVDVEMYENKQNEQSQPGNMYSLKESPSFLSAQKAQSNLDRVAKLVPRYATIELKENADLTKIANELSNRLSDDKDGEASSKRRSDLSAVTIAEPITMLDASFRQLDNLMDPNKVEMLTLIVRVEKESTGFSLSVIPAKGDMPIIDDATIMSLQHSLFCASLFDSIRQEIMSSVTDTNNIKSGLSSTLLTTSTVWLPACMDESFLPPPSRMASNGSFCIVHSQEGEVKIRLDSEYSLTLKLMEVGAAVELCEKERHISSTKTSGTFGVKFLRNFAQTILLQCQFLFHNHSITYHDKIIKRNKENPNILKGCVRLGAKILLQRKIQKLIKRKITEEKLNGGHNLSVEWLPLSVFDTCAHFTLCTGKLDTIDCIIDGGTLSVSKYSDEGFTTVKFASASELEEYLRFQYEI